MKTTIAPFAERYVQPYKIRIAHEMLRMLQTQLARMILKIIHAEGECNVTSIIIQVNRYCLTWKEQSVISQCLSKLRSYGIVKARRQGREVYYSVNVSRIEQIRNAIEQF